MAFYIFEAGETKGPIDEAAVRKGVLHGQISLKALACPVGEKEWKPLEQLFNPPLAPPAPLPDDRTAAMADIFDSVSKKIGSFADIEPVEGLSGREFFSEALKKHPDHEIEDYFSVGTTKTTPRLSEVVTHWPKPWIFFKAFVGSIVAFLGLYYMAIHFENPLAIPGVLMVGAFAVPCSVLVLFFELNVARNFSLYQLLRLTLLGGVLSLVICLFFFGWASGVGLNWMGASVAGLVEEPAKVLAMLIVAKRTQYRWTLNGLVIGACVGTGFAVVETAGYAFVSLVQDMQFGGLQTESTLILRALLYPLGGHGILSAIAGAALWRVKGDRRFEWAMLQDPRFLRLFAVSVLLHVLWNAPLDPPLFAKNVFIGAVAWWFILRLVQTGLREIRVAQSQAAVQQDQGVSNGHATA